MLGPLADLLTVQDGAADAITAALGAAAGAVAVADLDAAVAILATLKSEDAGQAALVIAAAGNGHGPRSVAMGPPGRPRGRRAAGRPRGRRPRGRRPSEPERS